MAARKTKAASKPAPRSAAAVTGTDEPGRDPKVFGGEGRINPAIDPSKTAEERLAALDKQHRIMRGG